MTGSCELVLESKLCAGIVILAKEIISDFIPVLCHGARNVNVINNAKKLVLQFLMYLLNVQ